MEIDEGATEFYENTKYSMYENYFAYNNFYTNKYGKGTILLWQNGVFLRNMI